MNITISRILVISLFTFLIIIGGTFLSISILKEESVKTHSKLIELYSNIFADNLTKTFNGFILLSNNLSLFLQNEDNEEIIENKLNDLLRSNLEIRSINILDSNNIVKYSSNNLNKNLEINTNDYFPQTNFDTKILRVGKTKEGRDLYDAIDINYVNNNLDINFFSILKELNIQKKNLKILITINGDYLLSNYNNLLDLNDCYIDLLRFDGNLLVTNDLKNYKSNLNNELLEKIKNRNAFSGVIEYNLEKTILSYQTSVYYPFIISVRINFDKALKDWEEKSHVFLLTIFVLLFLTISLIVSLFFIYNNRKNKELFLHKKFKTLFEQSNFFATIIDSKGKVLEYNDNFSIFFEKELKESFLWDYDCWQNEEKIWLESFFKNYTKNCKVQKELKILDKKGKENFLEVVISSFENNKKIELVLIALDITSKKLKEQQLKNASIVFENAHDGIIVTDEKANIINVNKAFEKATGFKLDEVFGKNPRILKSGIQDDKLYKNLWEELNNKGHWEGELVNRNKKGDHYLERIKINAVYNEENKLTNYIALFSDVTLQKEQEKLLKEKEELLFQQSKLSAMGEMIGNIAHQWRQPLSIISTSVGAIKLSMDSNLYSDEEKLNFMDTIINSTKYLSNTIDDFRNFYKNDLDKEEFCAKKAIESCLNLIKSEIIKYDISIEFKNETNFYLNGVKNQFLQVIINIFSNAKDAFLDKNIKNRRIFIELYEKNGKKCIEIYDTAGGINDNVITHIFEPYFTTKHKSLGTGIGLYMSQQIVTKQLNGEISVYNKEFIYENLNYKGACFKINI